MDAKEAIRYMVKQKVDCATRYGDNRVMACYQMAIEALEKQIPKEPIFDSGNRLCGECSEIIKAYESHCPFCGQAIKIDKE